MKKLRHTAFSLLLLGALGEGCASAPSNVVAQPMVCTQGAAAAKESQKLDPAEVERRLQSLRKRVAQAQHSLDALRKRHGIKNVK